jgi:hypothetical protein
VNRPPPDRKLVLEKARSALQALDSEAFDIRDRLGDAFEHLREVDLNDFPVEVLHDVLSLRHRLTWRNVHVAEENVRTTLTRMTEIEVGEAERMFRNLLLRLESVGSRIPA